MLRPLIVVDPHPRGLDEIFDARTRARFEQLGELVIHQGAGRRPPIENSGYVIDEITTRRSRRRRIPLRGWHASSLQKPWMTRSCKIWRI
jgi:hypothetical protein